MDIPNHDQLLDDPLYRRDVIDEERRTWEEEMGNVDEDEARADLDMNEDDGDEL